MLEGHGEAELPSAFSEQIEKENIELNTFSLLTADAVPEDADGILIYAPSRDISEEEKKLLAEYVSAGGKLIVMAGPTEDGTLTNLYSILADYGVETVDGVVVDIDRGHYAFQAPYVLLPDIAGSEITDPLIEEKYYAIMPISQGLIVEDTDTVTPLLTTSELSFSKAAVLLMRKRRGIRTDRLRWLFRFRHKMRAESFGLHLPIFWMICTMRIRQAQTLIWQ